MSFSFSITDRYAKSQDKNQMIKDVLSFICMFISVLILNSDLFMFLDGIDMVLIAGQLYNHNELLSLDQISHLCCHRAIYEQDSLRNLFFFSIRSTMMTEVIAQIGRYVKFSGVLHNFMSNLLLLAIFYCNALKTKSK